MARRRSRLSFLQRAADASDVGLNLNQLSQQLNDLQRVFELTLQVLDTQRLRSEQSRLTKRVTGGKNLWRAPTETTNDLIELGAIEADLNKINSVEKRLRDALLLVAFAQEDKQYEAEVIAEIPDELPRLRDDIAALETRTLLSGEYDSQPALVTIRTQRGGADAAEFAQQLLVMYQRWATRQGHDFDIQDISEAHQGIRSVTFSVDAANAYGVLSGEAGPHRVQTISKGKPQNAVVEVEVLPLLEERTHEIEEKDLQIDVFRSSGAGGQSVNTTDSAVRITHLPTGVVATSQNERSQLQNRATAMRTLEARVSEHYRKEDAAKVEAAQTEPQLDVPYVRTYSAKYIKDERTKYQTANVARVLAGEIGEILLETARHRARLQSNAGTTKGKRPALTRTRKAPKPDRGTPRTKR